jgi:hypothetical protein
VNSDDGTVEAVVPTYWERMQDRDWEGEYWVGCGAEEPPAWRQPYAQRYDGRPVAPGAA